MHTIGIQFTTLLFFQLQFPQHQGIRSKHILIARRPYMAGFGINRSIKTHGNHGIAQHVTNLFSTVKKKGIFKVLARFLHMKHHSFREKNGLTLRCNKGCSVYAETEHPLMTDYDSDIVGVERLHQQLRKLMSLIYDDIICYFHDEYGSVIFRFNCEDNKNIHSSDEQPVSFMIF